MLEGGGELGSPEPRAAPSVLNIENSNFSTGQKGALGTKAPPQPQDTDQDQSDLLRSLEGKDEGTP